MADLHIGPNGDPLTAYVAVTRVTGRDTLAILRPFDPKPYQQGTRLGRVLLLKVWRGEDIEWEAECGVLKRKNEYTAGQWKRADEKRVRGSLVTLPTFGSLVTLPTLLGRVASDPLVLFLWPCSLKNTSPRILFLVVACDPTYLFGRVASDHFLALAIPKHLP